LLKFPRAAGIAGGGAGGVTRVDLSVAPGADETTGDSVNVANFQNIDAGILTTGIAVTGSSSANSAEASGASSTANSTPVIRT